MRMINRLRKKNRNNIIIILSFVLSLASVTGLLSFVNNGKGCLVVYADWKEDENGKSYTDENGDNVKGFQTIKDKLYYFDEDGYLKTGKFYVKENEANYYADENGIIQTGEIELKDTFYITDETGRIKTGFIEYKNDRYYFNDNGDVVIGWFKIDDKWYYGGEGGRIATGFITVDGYRYYLLDDGVRVSDTVMDIDGVTYIFNADGSVDENATLLYPVYQYIAGERKKLKLQDVLMDTKIQACALLRAAALPDGFVDNDGDIEAMLGNRAVKSNGGYEFSYGGIENYSIDNMIANMKSDINLKRALKDKELKNIGIGAFEKDNIMYFDVILIK